MSKRGRGNTSLDSLEEGIKQLLEQVMADPEASLTDKCKVIDRALNLEKIKQKMADDAFGSGFLGDDEG